MLKLQQINKKRITCTLHNIKNKKTKCTELKLHALLKKNYLQVMWMYWCFLN